MIDEKTLLSKLREIKQEAWNSDRNEKEYTRGYYWGMYWTVLTLEKIVGSIEIDCEHTKGGA